MQSHVWATDTQGASVLLSDPDIWNCYKSSIESLYYTEMGASLAVLRAGYNINCLMTR